MERNEKKRLRDQIGDHLDVSGTRLTGQGALARRTLTCLCDRR